jgi:hypothetical protein
MNNKVALISSFCDSENKIAILNENIKKLKDNNLDVILISPLVLPEETVKLCDYFFYTKDNEILKWPLNVQIFTCSYSFSNGFDLIHKHYMGDYGWTGLNHIKKLTEIALTFNYDYFYNLIYDLKIDDNIIKLLNNPKDNLFCRFQRYGRDFLCISLHFLVCNRENAKNLSNFITIENYLNFLNSSKMPIGKTAEGFISEYEKLLKYEIADFMVTDQIDLDLGAVLFNHSKIDDLRFFIEKNSEDLFSDIKICIIENPKKKKIEIIINEECQVVDTEMKIFPLGVKFLDIESIFIKAGEDVMDLMPVLKSLGCTYMELKLRVE